MDEIVIAGKSYTPAEVAVLAKAGVLNLGSGEKHDTSSATPNATPTHGPFPGNNAQFGIFSGAGVRPGYWNATPRVRSFASIIPMYKSLYMNELIDIATGVTAGSGTNQTSACVVGPKPGQLKAMQIAATFGIIHESTKIFDVTQAGMRRNRADVDRESFNTAMIENAWLPQVPGINGTGSLETALRVEMYALGISLEQSISQVHFTGVAGTENNTYLGVARQWNGLDRIIRTGYTDNVTGVAAAAADSVVVSFNAEADGGTDANGRTLVASLTDTYFGINDFLKKIGITAQHVLVMRPDMFRAIAQVWACAYYTTRCLSSNAGQPLVRDAVAQHTGLEAMWAGQYLPMEGSNIPVMLDDSIARDTLGNGHYKSDIYGIALTGNGRPVLYGEYFDMNNPEAMEVVNYGGFADSETATANNGMYRVFKRKTGGCVEFDLFARARLISDAPFMHFRLDDIRYNSYYDQRDATPGLSYYVNGGSTYRL